MHLIDHGVGGPVRRRKRGTFILPPSGRVGLPEIDHRRTFAIDTGCTRVWVRYLAAPLSANLNAEYITPSFPVTRSFYPPGPVRTAAHVQHFSGNRDAVIGVKR